MPGAVYQNIKRCHSLSFIHLFHHHDLHKFLVRCQGQSIVCSLGWWFAQCVHCLLVAVAVYGRVPLQAIGSAFADTAQEVHKVDNRAINVLNPFWWIVFWPVDHADCMVDHLKVKVCHFAPATAQEEGTSIPRSFPCIRNICSA